jgi:hypothetical protein
MNWFILLELTSMIAVIARDRKIAKIAIIAKIAGI